MVALLSCWTSSHPMEFGYVLVTWSKYKVWTTFSTFNTQIFYLRVIKVDDYTIFFYCEYAQSLKIVEYICICIYIYIYIYIYIFCCGFHAIFLEYFWCACEVFGTINSWPWLHKESHSLLAVGWNRKSARQWDTIERVCNFSQIYLRIVSKFCF